MDSPSSFEQKPIETDLKTIAHEINYGEIHGEAEDKKLEGVEAVKNAIRAFPALHNNQKPGTAAAAAPADDGQVPAYAQTAAPEVKREIEHLVDVALEQGISKALTESEKSPYFVQDAFHDALAGKLYPELQKRGLIK